MAFSADGMDILSQVGTGTNGRCVTVDVNISNAFPQPIDDPYRLSI